jgi:RND family efflux transporter MFP subunit
MCPELQQPPQPEPSVRNRKPALLRLLLPAIVVISAVVVAAWLLQTGPQAKPRPKVRNATIVDVRPIKFDRQATTISVMGTVIPQREVILKPQVSGKIISMSDKLIPGGRFAKDEPLLTIDPSDYQLSVQQLASEVARVKADWQIELGWQRVARKEYELLGESVTDEEKALMLREPQLANIKAVLDATTARLEQAQLDLQRTVVTAPFNAVVISREINLGTSASPSATLATLVGSDSYWIDALVPSSLLKWISTGQEGRADGSQVRIFDSAAWGAEQYRTGRVLGLTAMVEEQGRMAKLLVEIPDPLALRTGAKGQPELLLGSYVRVEIVGASVPQAALVERDLIRDGNHVWIMDARSTLDIRPVEIAFRGQESVLVTGGIREGELLVTSNLPSPVQGMSLRTRGDAALESGAGAQAKP